ncbi:1006_t:CDS:2 [Diversispora eburnea]|uniref:1006_t:CDS:1 n=1 Tax=Diversispora eburnea TaxID=1213867 RepID=A0A9N9AE80_9GLOM|nr:1006_t:CDS:2 [Diversispora eburnea]
MTNKRVQRDDSTDSSKIDTNKNTEPSTKGAGFMVRIMELERNAKESAENEKRSRIENSELKSRVTKLERDIEEIK